MGVEAPIHTNMRFYNCPDLDLITVGSGNVLTIRVGSPGGASKT